MNVLCVIPARYASTRLPGKPLADIAGKPMIQRVYERASQAKVPTAVLVATDHPLVEEAVKKFGGISGDLAGWFLQKAEFWMLAAMVACQCLEGKI